MQPLTDKSLLETNWSVCVAQVLNALAPLQQEQGDVSGADSMLKSSFTLSKNLQDLPSQVALSAQWM